MIPVGGASQEEMVLLAHCSLGNRRRRASAAHRSVHTVPVPSVRPQSSSLNRDHFAKQSLKTHPRFVTTTQLLHASLWTDICEELGSLRFQRSCRRMETQIHVPVGSPVIRKISVFVDEHSVKEGAMKLIKELRPAWEPDSVRTKSFTDGTTNKLVGCYVDDSPDDVVLVRVYGNKTELIVDRDNELKSFQVLHANGCAPRLYCTFQNGICYEFMQGDALGPQDVRDPTLIRLISREMARIHAIHAHNGCIPKPNLWIKMRQYFSLVATEFTDQASNIRIQQEVPSKAVLEQEMVWMKEHLSTLGSPVVLCHNDLLCKNIIHNSKEGHVRFIDYEYSSYNYQAFDIGNHFNEFAGMAELDYGLYPSPQMQMDWLKQYLQAYKLFTKNTDQVSQRELETLYVQVNKFALASHFFWGFWALIQAKYSTIDFDFLGYAVLRFNQYFHIKPTVMALQIPE